MTGTRFRIRPLPFAIGRRLAWDALVIWIGVRVVIAAGAASMRVPSPLLPAPRTSVLIVTVVVVLCALQVSRLRETAFLRNLGVSLSTQLGWSFAVAGTLELLARLLAGSLGGGL
jgi:hypothetical protein